MSIDIKKQIKLIETEILNYNIEEVNKLLNVLFEYISVGLQKNEIKNSEELNEILIKIEKSISNKDYLLLSDILIFELYEIMPDTYLN